MREVSIASLYRETPEDLGALDEAAQEDAAIGRDVVEDEIPGYRRDEAIVSSRCDRTDVRLFFRLVCVPDLARHGGPGALPGLDVPVDPARRRGSAFD